MRTWQLPMRFDAAIPVLRCWTTLAVTLAAVTSGIQGWCDPPAPSSVSRELHSAVAARAYRRIYVPADRVDAWPREGRKYIPVEEKDFENWIETANKLGGSEQLSVTIDAANYDGALTSDGQLNGHGDWTITVRGDRPVFLSLPNESLVIRNAHWKDHSEEVVRLGNWGTSDGSPHEFGLMVPRSGKLEFDWSIRPQPRNNSLEFPWDVPAAINTRLTLELDDGQTPGIEAGAILESTLASPDNPSAKNVAHKRQWVLAFGPAASRRVLRIANTDGPRVEQSRQLELRGNIAYQVEQRGVEILAKWKLEGQLNEQRDLTLSLPAGIQMLSVAAEGQALNWRIARNASPKKDQAIIQLPSNGETRSLNLQLAFWQPITFDQAWQLPSLWPEGVFWRAADISVSIAPELELRRLVPFDCQQTSVAHLGTGSAEAETFSFAAYSPTAAVEVIVGRREADAQVQIGTSLALTDPDVIGKLVSRWSVSRGQVHQLSGTLGRGWSIETVETIPADAMAEWFVDRHGDRRELEIRLTDAVTPTRAISVTVTGRLQRFNVAETMSADMLQIVHWNAARVARHLLSFQSSEPYDVETSGDATRVAGESFGADDLALLDDAAERTEIIDMTRAGDNASLRLTAKRGQYSAEIEYEAECSGEELKDTWRIVARPRSSAIDRLLVYATAPLGGSPRWIEKTSGVPITAELLPAEAPLRRSLPNEGEVWLLRLPQPTSNTVEVSLGTVVSLLNRMAVPLLALPEAIDQNGLVSVRTPLSATPAVQVKGFESLPSPNQPNDPDTQSLNPVRLAYRYAPQDCLDPSRAPRLDVGAIDKPGSSLLTVRHLSVESFLNADGHARHRAEFHLQNCGASDFRIAIAENSMVNAAYVDGLPVSLAAGNQSEISIPLLPRVSSPTVSIVVETREDRGMVYGSIASPIAGELYPVLTSEWTTWLPDGLVATNGEGSNDAFDWRQRIFGFLAANRSESAFDPLQLASWAGISSEVSGSRDSGMAVQQTVNRVGADGPLVSALSQTPFPGVTAFNVLPTIAAAVEANQFTPVSTSSKPLGWHPVVHRFVACGPTGTITVSRPATLRSWAVACLLISLVLNGALHARWHIQVFEITAACCLAQMLPVAVAPLATGVMWGAVFAILLKWLRPSQIRAEVRPSRSVATPAMLTVVLATFCGSRSLSAEPEGRAPLPSEPSATDSRIESVLIPIDAQKKRVGTKVYLSEQFLRDLFGTKANTTSIDHQWLITAAEYTGELTESRRPSEYAAAVWELAFTLETSVRQTVVRLPVVRSEAEWQPSAMLDGVPQPIDWAQDGQSCVVVIPEPGRYVLTVFCTPKVGQTGGRGQLSLTVPPLPVARISLRMPESLTDVEVPNATLTRPISNRSNSLAGELFHSDRIRVNWPLLATKEAAQRLNLSELNWLYFGEPGVEIATKLIVEGGARRTEVLTIRYDDRWTLLTESPSVVKNAQPSATDHLQSLQIRLPTDENDRQEVVIHWRLSDVPEVGSVRIPLIAISPTPPTQRWFAVSVDPEYDCLSAGNSIATTTAKEFQTKWGNGSDLPVPQIALANVPDNADLVYTFRPREQSSNVREIIHVAVGAPSTRVVYQADIAPGPANCFQARLAVPKNLVIDRVTLTKVDQPIPIRWTRIDASQIAVFFGLAVSSDSRLVVSGSISSPENQPFTLPRITMAANSPTAQTVQLYRTDNVNLQLHGFPETNSAKPSSTVSPPADWVVRPVGVFTLNESAVLAARIMVQPNRPVVHGSALTHLSLEDGKWWAELHANLVVEQDNLDVVQLKIPGICIGPFDIKTNAPVTTEAKDQQGGARTLKVRLGTPVAQGREFTLRLRTPLGSAGSSIVAVPDIEIAPFAGRRIISVPQAVKSQLFGWTSVGTKPVETPAEWREDVADATSHEWLEVVKSPFRVVLQSQPVRPSAPGVRFAETSVVMDQDGGQILASRFVIFPDGLTQCVLALPVDQQLVSAELDSQPALIVPKSATEFQVTLESASLPQVLNVLSRVTNAKSFDLHELVRPTLFIGEEPMPTNVSLWTLIQPSGMQPVEAVNASSVNEVDFAALRFDRLVSLAERAAATLNELPHANAVGWHDSWGSMLRAAQTDALQALSHPAVRPTISQLSDSAAEQVQLAGKRLEIWNDAVLGNATLSRPQSRNAISWASLTEQPYLRNESRQAHASVTNYVFDGDKNQLSLVNRGVATRSMTSRYLPMVAVVGISALLVLLQSNPFVIDFLCRWPQAIGMVVGVFYWTFLWPSWLGLLIVAASLWLGLRTAWPGRAIRPEASTVLRSTRTLPSQ